MRVTQQSTLTMATLPPDKTMLVLARGFVNYTDKSPCETKDKEFRKTLGVSSGLARLIWQLLETHKGDELRQGKVREIHLLWTYLFLRQYTGERILATLVNTTEKTVRKWIFKMIPLLRDLPVVSYLFIYFFLIFFSNYFFFSVLC